MNDRATFNKAGWEWYFENPPSLCRRYLPITGHRPSNTCYCKPLIQNEATYTVVVHHQ